MRSPFIESVAILFLLFNQFLLVMYLKDILAETTPATYRRIVVRAGLIATLICLVFGWFGEYVFTNVLMAKYASLQVFGGIVFLIIGLRFVFAGSDAIVTLRGDPDHITGSIVMPIMVGPGTISASIVAGKRLGPFGSTAAIALSITVTVLVLMLLRHMYDVAQSRNERLVLRYMEAAGRVAALVVGTFSIEMIMRGAAVWWNEAF